jgi:hypothetical protein
LICHPPSNNSCNRKLFSYRMDQFLANTVFHVSTDICVWFCQQRSSVVSRVLMSGRKSVAKEKSVHIHCHHHHHHRRRGFHLSEIQLLKENTIVNTDHSGRAV